MFEREALSIDVSVRLKQIREERGLSMRDLAARSGLSANAISTIERGKVSPSVSTLYKLAEALGISVTLFFATEEKKGRIVFIGNDERIRVPFDRGIWEGLGGEQFAGRVEPFLLTLESGSGSGPHSIVHTGHEFVLCLRGRIEYQVENQIYNMEAGDSLIFSAHLEHKWRNASTTVANILVVLSDFSEGDRPSVMHMATKHYQP